MEKKIANLEKNFKKTEEKKLEVGDDNGTDEDLDLSFGPRYCDKCGYEAEDGYQLDGHTWSEHEDDNDVELLPCQHCDKRFSILKELMTHKKSNHVENVSIWWPLSNGACPYEETCWFQHEEHSIETNMEQGLICNICKETFKSRNEFMMHKRIQHEENVQTCKLIKKETALLTENVGFLIGKIKNKKVQY